MPASAASVLAASAAFAHAQRTGAGAALSGERALHIDTRRTQRDAAAMAGAGRRLRRGMAFPDAADRAGAKSGRSADAAAALQLGQRQRRRHAERPVAVVLRKK